MLSPVNVPFSDTPIRSQHHSRCAAQVYEQLYCEPMTPTQLHPDRSIKITEISDISRCRVLAEQISEDEGASESKCLTCGDSTFTYNSAAMKEYTCAGLQKHRGYHEISAGSPNRPL